MDLNPAPPALYAWAFVVGAAFGSFLNVVIARLPHGQSLVKPRSRCPKCLAPIAWYDNVPIVSWVILRARCRRCRAPISARYPLVELAGGVLALLALHRHGFTGAAAAEFGFAMVLTALALIDIDTWLLPHALTWPLIAAGIGLSWLGVTQAESVRLSLYGASIAWGAFFLISVISEKLLGNEALGFGDVWLLAGIGAWFGPYALLPVVFLAAFQGSVVGLTLIALGKAEKGPEAAAAPPPEASNPTATANPTPNATANPNVPLTPTLSLRERETEFPERETEFPERETGAAEGDDWIPPKHALYFGPFLVAGALEWLYLSDHLERFFPSLRFVIRLFK